MSAGGSAELLALSKQERTASQSVAAALKKQEMDKARLSEQMKDVKHQGLVMKLQSGFRGFVGRKRVWSIKHGGRSLNIKDLNYGLDQLGKSPSSLHGRNHAYLSFTLRHEKINDLTLLMQYPLLTSVDVCHNNLFTLEALSAMPYLWTVKAAHNEVTTAIDFAAPRPELVAHGDSWIGSSLRELDLARNHVSVLEDRMGRHPLLTRLNLSHNKLTGNLSALRPLRLLRFLDASHNQLTSDFGIAGLPLEQVNLAENCLRVVDQLGMLPALVDLDLHNNQVASLYGLRDANRLLTLDYRGNTMVDIDELIHLKDIQSLQLEGNPCYGLEKEKALAEEAAALASAGGVRDPHAPPPDGLTEDEFRLHVVARLQSLVSLDGQVVTAEDKVRAINALDFPSHERHNRVAAWQRAFDPSGTEAQSAANNADKLKTHDRRALVDLEFLDHLVAMQPIGSQQGRCAPPPPSMTALALQASSENDSGLPLLGGSGGGGDLAPSNQLNNGGADAVGDPAGGVGSKGGSSVLQGGGSRGGMGSRKSSGFDPVGRGESELLHFAVHGAKPSGVEAPFPLVGLGSQPQLFEAVLKVKVVDARSGEPIPGASVTLSGAGSSANSDIALTSPSDPRALAAWAGSRLSSSSTGGSIDSSSTSAHVPPGQSACSQAKWLPPPVVLVRHTSSEGQCEVRVDASSVAGLPQERPPQSAVNAKAWPLIASQREAVAGSPGTSSELASVMREYGYGQNDDNDDDESRYSSDDENGGRSPRPEDSEDDVGSAGLASRKIAALSKARELVGNPLGTPLSAPAPQPLRATVSAPGYAPLEHMLPGLTWPLSHCLSGGEVRKTTVKMLPLLATSADLENAKERASKVKATALAAENVSGCSGSALAPIAAPSSSSSFSSAASSSSSRKPQPRRRRGNSVDQPSPLPAPAGFNGTWHRADYPISLTCAVPGAPPQAFVDNSGSGHRHRSPKNSASGSSNAQASGVLMVRLAPNALTAEDPCLDNNAGSNGASDGAPCKGLVRVCLVASFYDARNLPGPSRVIMNSGNTGNSAHVASSSLLQATVGFQISAFGALGEPLYLRKGVTAAVGLGTDPLNAPSPLAIDRNLSLARYDPLTSVWRTETASDTEATPGASSSGAALSLVCKADGSRLQLGNSTMKGASLDAEALAAVADEPFTSTCAPAPVLLPRFPFNTGEPADLQEEEEIPGVGLIARCADEVMQRLPLCAVGTNERKSLERALASRLPSEVLQAAALDGDFASSYNNFGGDDKTAAEAAAEAAENAIASVCSDTLVLRRHCRRAVSKHLLVALGSLVQDASKAMRQARQDCAVGMAAASGAAAAAHVKERGAADADAGAEEGVKEQASSKLAAGVGSTVAAFRAKHLAAQALKSKASANTGSSKEISNTTSTTPLALLEAETLAAEALGKACWDPACQPTTQSVDTALGAALRSAFNGESLSYTMSSEGGGSGGPSRPDSRDSFAAAFGPPGTAGSQGSINSSSASSAQRGNLNSGASSPNLSDVTATAAARLASDPHLSSLLRGCALRRVLPHLSPEACCALLTDFNGDLCNAVRSAAAPPVTPLPALIPMPQAPQADATASAAAGDSGAAATTKEDESAAQLALLGGIRRRGALRALCRNLLTKAAGADSSSSVSLVVVATEELDRALAAAQASRNGDVASRRAAAEASSRGGSHHNHNDLGGPQVAAATALALLGDEDSDEAVARAAAESLVDMPGFALRQSLAQRCCSWPLAPPPPPAAAAQPGASTVEAKAAEMVGMGTQLGLWTGSDVIIAAGGVQGRSEAGDSGGKGHKDDKKGGKEAKGAKKDEKAAAKGGGKDKGKKGKDEPAHVEEAHASASEPIMDAWALSLPPPTDAAAVNAGWASLCGLEHAKPLLVLFAASDAARELTAQGKAAPMPEPEKADKRGKGGAAASAAAPAEPVAVASCPSGSTDGDDDDDGSTDGSGASSGASGGVAGLELPLPDDPTSLAHNWPDDANNSSVLALFAPRDKDDDTSMNSKAPGSKDGNNSSSETGAQASLSLAPLPPPVKLVNALYGVMGATLWRTGGVPQPTSALVAAAPQAVPAKPATPGKGGKKANNAQAAAEAAAAAAAAAQELAKVQRASAEWGRTTDSRARSRLNKCVVALYAGLEARGFLRLADELGKGAGGEGSAVGGSSGGSGAGGAASSGKSSRDVIFSVELTGPAEVLAALDARNHDPESAAISLLESRAVLRRATMLETKLRAQDALCATALGPAAAAAAAGGASSNAGAEAAASILGGSEPLHFAWLEPVLRRHPEVCLSGAEVERAVEVAEAAVDAAEREQLELLKAEARAAGEDEAAVEHGRHGHKSHGHHHHHGRHGHRRHEHDAAAAAEANSGATMRQQNPIKVLALRHEAVIGRATASLCSQAAIVVRHRIAVETSPWSADQVASQVLQKPLPSSLESIAVRDASFKAVAEQEAQERSGAQEAPHKGGNSSSSSSAAAATAASTGGRPLTASRTGRLHVTGGRLPLSSPDVYKVDVSRVPVLFSRAVVKAACSATKRGGPDAALASLHATPRAVALLHGPTHLTKLGLAAALPLLSSQVNKESNSGANGDSKFFPGSRAATAALTDSSGKNMDLSGEVEAALSASKNDLPAALDLLVLDSRVMQRAAAWRCRTRISNALGPAAARAFQVTAKRAGGSGDLIARALAEAHAAGEAAAKAAVAAAQASANKKAAEAAAATEAAAEGTSDTEAGRDAAATTNGVLAIKELVVAPPVDSEAAVASALQAARESGDLDLAQLLAIGFAPVMPEITTLCPRAAAAEEGGKHSKGHRAKSSSRGGGGGSPSKGRNSPNSRGKGSDESESFEERAAARRFEAMALGVARARRIADRASQQLLLPPRAGDLRLQRPPPLSRPATAAAAAASSAVPANDDPSLDAWAVPATDGRIASLRSICEPTPWLMEARASVVQAVATVVANARNGLPQEVDSQLNALWHDDKLFDVRSDSNLQKEEEEEVKLSQAKSDLAGLLPNWLLDAAVSRAVVREATVEHAYRPPPSALKKAKKSGDEAPAAPLVAETPTPKGGKKGAKAAPAAAAAAPAAADPSSVAAPSSGSYSFVVPPGPRTRAPPCPARPWPLSVSDEDAAVASTVAAAAETLEEEPNPEGVAAAAQAQALADRLAATPSGPAIAPEGGPGCAAAVRWRYIVCEAARALLNDNATVLKQVSYRKVQRLLATSLPFTQVAPELLRAAWDVTGGNVQRAASLLAKDAQVLENGWARGEAPLGRLMQSLTGASSSSDNNTDAANNAVSDVESNGVFRGAAEANDDSASRPKDWDESSVESGAGDSDDGDGDMNSPLQIEAAPEIAPAATTGENPPSAAAAPLVEGAPRSASSSRGSQRRRPSASSRSSRPPNGGWTMDALLLAADRGAQNAAVAAAAVSTTTSASKGGKRAPKAAMSAALTPVPSAGPIVAPIRQLLPMLRARSAWLSATVGVLISEHDLVFVLLQAAVGLPHYCALPCPPHLEATQEAAAVAAAEGTSGAVVAATAGEEAAMPTIKESQGGDTAISDSANPFPGSKPGQQQQQAPPQLAPSKANGLEPSPTSICEVHCAVAFERLYALPQVNAGTSLATRGAVAYQRKLDLARIVPEAEAAKRARESTLTTATAGAGKSSSAVSSSNARGKVPGKVASRSGSTRGSLVTCGQGAVAAAPVMSDMSERFEVTIPRLGWWCVNECAPPPALLRGRLVFTTAVIEALFSELFHAPNGNINNNIGGSLDLGSATVGSGGSVSSRSSASTGSDRPTTLRNNNNNSNSLLAAGKGSFDSGNARPSPMGSSSDNDDHAAATAAFFANSRSFFDPSLPAPTPQAPQALAARANLLLSRLLVVASTAPTANGGFTSSPAVLGVVQTGLDETVLCFSVDALAGLPVKLEVGVDVGDLQSVGAGAVIPAATHHSSVFGPYEVPAAGGEVRAGELVFPALEF